MTWNLFFWLKRKDRTKRRFTFTYNPFIWSKWSGKRELRDILAKRDRTINMMDSILDDQIKNLRVLSVEHEAYENVLLAIATKGNPNLIPEVEAIYKMAREVLGR